MNTNKFKYKCFNNFVLRTPLRSLDYILSLFQNTETSLHQIKETYKDPIIQEAIFIASPSLHQQLLKWLNNELTNKKDIEHLCFSLTKYLLRMGSRCTPFGLFAGYALGNFDNETNIELDHINKYYAHLRLDMNYLCALAIDLAKIPEIKNQIKFYPNSSIYTSGDHLRYVEYKYINGQRNHFIVGVETSDYIINAIKKAENGANIQTLSNLLVDEEITPGEATEFINQLIESQLLISELEPSVTGPEFLDQIIKALQPLKGIDQIVNYLEDVKADITKISQKPIGIQADYYTNIARKLENLKTKFDLKYLFQTDLVVKVNKINIDKKIINDIQIGLSVLNKLTPSYENNNLSKFKEAFYERYEEREIPLSKALDIESGIGYIQTSGTGDVAPLVDDIFLPDKNNDPNRKVTLNAFQSLLLKKQIAAKTNNLKVIEIFEKDLADFESNWDDLPPTISAMVEIYKNSYEKNDEYLIYLGSVGGSSAANLLSRFCHSNKDLYGYAKTITEIEQKNSKDRLYAEIVHLPESRTGNILLRPQLRDYEIPYLAKTSVPKKYQIPLHDILISVKQGRQIVLRSKSLNKEIIPRLSNAHNYANNALPVYRFLCDLQNQGLRGGIGFNWGDVNQEFSFLPRVCYKNLILSKASWNFKNGDFEHLLKLKNNNDIKLAFTAWKQKYDLPDFAVLADSDNELLLNLNNLQCIKTLLSLIKKRSGFQLKEFLFNKENTLVTNGKNNYTNQMVFSFYKEQIQN